MASHRPFTRSQQRQNNAFLRALERTGNIRLAARECGLDHTTMRSRRKRDPALDQRWTAALAVAEARLHAAPGRRITARGRADLYRTEGGEAVTVLLANGRVQVRRARAGGVTQHALQGFLLALAGTANIALAAASVGINPSAIHRRRRRDPGFAREVLEALAQGYERVEGALLESFMPADAAATAWQDNEPPAIPPMNAAQAIQLLSLHRRSVRWREADLAQRLLPGETSDARAAKLGRLYRARLTAEAEERGAARSLRNEPPGADEPPPIVLPDLAQVTGWSKARDGAGGHGPAAMFGGWRIEHMEAASRAAAEARRAEAARVEAEARAAMLRGQDEVLARMRADREGRKRGRGASGK